MKHQSNIPPTVKTRFVKAAAASALILSNPVSTWGQQFEVDFVDSPMIVELFTSQSCASCPPAERFATVELREMESVVPLALHVDYWNHLGWIDEHSNAAFTARQQSYANAAKLPFIFTPQIVIQGQYLIAGHAEDRIREIINSIGVGLGRQQPLFLSAEQVASGFDVKLLNCSNTAGSYFIQRVLYNDQVIETEIDSGENKGLKLIHSNAVMNMREYLWDGRTEFEFVDDNLEIGRETSVLVMLQEAVKKERYYGPIVTSLRLKNYSDEVLQYLRISYSDAYNSHCQTTATGELIFMQSDR